MIPPWQEMLSALLAYVKGNHRSPVDSPHKGLIMWSVNGFSIANQNELLNRLWKNRQFETPLRHCYYVTMAHKTQTHFSSAINLVAVCIDSWNIMSHRYKHDFMVLCFVTKPDGQTRLMNNWNTTNRKPFEWILRYISYSTLSIGNGIYFSVEEHVIPKFPCVCSDNTTLCFASMFSPIVNMEKLLKNNSSGRWFGTLHSSYDVTVMVMVSSQFVVTNEVVTKRFLIYRENEICIATAIIGPMEITDPPVKCFKHFAWFCKHR